MPTETLPKDERRVPQTLPRAPTASAELRAAWRHEALVPRQTGWRGIAHKALLACGIVAPLVYLASDVIAGMRWEGYSFRDQTISELNAIGAPTRALTIALGLAGYTFLVAFSVGVWRSAAVNRRLRLVGGALVVIGVLSLWAVPFASMHVREAEESLTDTLHLVGGAIVLPLLLGIIGFGAAVFGKWYRLYSIATIAVMLAFGVWSGLDGAAITDNLATPWVGVKERISVYAYQLWLVVFAIALARTHLAAVADRGEEVPTNAIPLALTGEERGTMIPHSPHISRVVIVGGGMGGIEAAKTLAKAPVAVTLVDARNYYLFQPLIYEVANALLNVEDVAHSIRGLLRGRRNAHFRLGTASKVDWDRKEVVLADGDRLGFEYLVLSAGLEVDFRGVPGAANYGLPLKSLDDALRIRTRMLRRLELAAADPQLVPAGALDVVIVGGGTTGVETAAAFAEIYRHALCEEFPELDLSQTSVVLLEAGDAILAGFHPRLRCAAQRMLEQRGVAVRLRSPVAEVGPASVKLTDGTEIAAGMIVWATGVRAPVLADSLRVPQAADGRVLVEPNLSLPGHPEAFVIGDMATLPWSKGGLHPALAQFAIQGGRHAAREIKRRLAGKPPRAFHYRDKGMTASIGRDAAVVQAGPIRFGGRAAFFFWRFLHALYVPGARNRVSVTLTWIWTYATRRRAALLLVGEPTPSREPIQPLAGAPEAPEVAPSPPGERRHALAKGGGLHVR